MLKTYTKRILGTLVLICGVLSPYSFFHHENKVLEQQTGIHTADIKLNIAYGDTTGSTTNNTSKETDRQIAGSLEAFLKVVYVLLWPLLWIAGWAMDNSLVYGEIFGLDQALFKFWQIMKNFANFALGFLFVFSIVKYILNPSEKKHPKDMISKLLVAGVGVQLSWFIMGALVDLSSVLTIGVGGLPLNLIDQADIGSKPIFGVVTKVKLNDAIGTNDGSVILYKWPGSSITSDTKFLLPCLFTNGKIDWSDNWKTAFGVNSASSNITGTSYTWNNINSEYCIASNNIINKDIYEDPPASYVAKDGKKYTPTRKSPVFSDGSPETSDIISISRDRATQTACSSSDICQTMGSFTKRAGGFQGAFYSLYTSVLSLSTIHVGVPKSNTSLVMETLIKTLMGLAYLIPIAILCIVLIMRVGYLWLIIAFSPFIVLAEVKDLGIGGLKDGVKVIGKTAFNAKNVISLLLLPVVVTFAVSLSIVFLSSLSEGLTKDGSQESLGIYSRTEGNYKCYDIVLTDICLDIPKNNIGTGIFDYFSWTIMNLFGIGMMWFIVMAALKSSELTKGIAEQVEKLSGSLLQSAPIIPIGGGKFTSAGSVGKLPTQISEDLGYARNVDSKALSDYVRGVKDVKTPAATGAAATTAAPVTTATSYTPTAAQITDATTAINTAIANPTTVNTTNSAQLAEKISKAGGITNQPKSVAALFESQEGKKLFGNYLATNPKDANKAPNIENLQKIYKASGGEDTKRDTIKKEIEAEQNKVAPTSTTPPINTTATTPTVTIKDKTYTFSSNKISVKDKVSNKTDELDVSKLSSKADLDKYASYLNDLKDQSKNLDKSLDRDSFKTAKTFTVKENNKDVIYKVALNTAGDKIEITV